MSGVTAEDWQLLSFFEVEPTLRDSDVPWCYNDAVYEIQQGNLRLNFAIDPGYRDLRIILQHDGQRLYELNAIDVKDVRYTNDVGKEQLEIVINERESMLLRIKPRIELTHRFDGRP